MDDLEQARETVTTMCRDFADHADVSEATWAQIAEFEQPEPETVDEDGGVRVSISLTPADWDSRIMAILTRPRIGSDIKLARALTVVWRAEDAESRVAEDLVCEVERITGERVFE